MAAHFQNEVLSDHIVIKVKKKLDVSDIGEFTAAWKEATASDNCRVILDLSELNFMDSSGIGAIVSMRNNIVSRNGRLVVLNGPNNICRLFEITGMRSKLEVRDDMEEAVKSVLS